MSDHNEPFEGDETLHKEEVHEENKKEAQKMRDHENKNPNLEKERNPIHHGIGNK